MVKTRQATAADLESIVPLFDAYRQFYRQPSDVEGARRFLRERLEHQQSTIFIALEGADAVGFAQLYPSFSSGALARIFILNDLFVAPPARRRGIGAALLAAAAEHGRQAGTLRLVLSTEITNTKAQRLYEKLGWKLDTEFLVYKLAL